jgi:hypothetical protein
MLEPGLVFRTHIGGDVFVFVVYSEQILELHGVVFITHVGRFKHFVYTEHLWSF